MIKLTKKSSAKRIREAWLEALTSGEYKQGKSYLHQKTKKGEDRFCCLGVLCDLAVKARVIDAPEEDEDRVVVYDGDAEKLPNSVLDWAKLKNSTGEPENENFVGEEAWLTKGLKKESLASLNDAGIKFPTIAKIIKENEDVLFYK